MVTRSAGILLHRSGAEGVEVWIGHMGGPYWAKKQERAWSIPKGELEPGEEPLAAARREFAEELGVPAPDVGYRHLGEFRYSSGKLLHVFAAEARDFPPADLSFGTFALEWPPRSGRMVDFPELDRAGWVAVGRARDLLVAGQAPVLDAL